MKYQVINGNNISVLKTFPDNHFDSIVTDPPYGIDFLGKEWDANTGALETYTECLRVLKPGGYLLAFSAARTYHHLAVTVEQAGFEIRDQIMWIYSSGFPKSQDVGRSIQRSIGVEETKKNPKASKSTFNNVLSEAQDKQRDNLSDACQPGSAEQVVCTDPVAQQWEGWGTCLKPAHEPIVMARKPTKLSFAENVQQWGMGALNIEDSRIPGLTEKELNWTPQRQQATDNTEIGTFGASGLIGKEIPMFNEAGRFPSNVIGEIEGYQKYFYCPKVGRAERHTGFDLSTVPTNEFNDPSKVKDHPLWDESIGSSVSRLQDKIRKTNPPGNNHPTVKPIELMKYLIRLVTPAGGHVLDPFNGSGSTGCAAVELDYEYTGIELDPKYVEIARKRIEAWYAQTHANTFTELFE